MENSKVEPKWDLNNERENYLELWKWFIDDASKIKDRMWIMATFFYTVLGALLGFIGKQWVSGGNIFENLQQPDLVLVVSFLGCVLSGYGIYMLWMYGKHIRMGWNRADYMRFRINGLNEIWCFNNSKFLTRDEDLKKKYPKRIPEVAVVLIILMALFFIINAVIILFILK